MSDDRMDDDLDRRLRDALRAEAEGVEADDALLRRIQTEGLPGGKDAIRHRQLLAVAAVVLVAGIIGAVLRSIDDDDQRIDLVGPPTPALACENPEPVFDRRYELSVYAWPDATEADRARIQAHLDDDLRVDETEAKTAEEAAAEYHDWANAHMASLDGTYLDALTLVDVDDGADLRAVVAGLNRLRDVRFVNVFCRGELGEVGDLDGMPVQIECPPYDLLFLLTPVVTPDERAAFEERFSTDPRVESFEYVPVEETGGEQGPVYRVQLTSDPGTGEPAPDDSEVREDIGRLHGTSFVLERRRCRVEPGATDGASPGPAARPTEAVIVRADTGDIVMVDLETGEQRVLLDAPAQEERDPDTGMLGFVDDVELSPDGQWVYFSTCCEPAAGEFYRVSVDDPAPDALEHPLGTGRSPRVQPHGAFVATIDGGTRVLVHGAGPDGAIVIDRYAPGQNVVFDVEWSPDGRRLAVRLGADVETRRAEVYEIVDGAARLVEEVPLSAEGYGDKVYWSPDGELLIEDNPSGAGAGRPDTSYQWRLSPGEGGGAGAFVRRVGEEWTYLEMDVEASAIDW